MPALRSSLEFSPSNWTTERITDLVQRRFNKRPCWYQVEVAKAFYAGRDVIGCAPTGAGKTLSFWIPLLMAQEDKCEKILFVVSPLNVLAKQNVETLSDAGISAIAVSAENASTSTFKDIQQGRYQVIVTNPEMLMTADGFRELWKIPAFTHRILGFVFDEAHCITQWGKFRKHYLAVGIIRYLISDPIPFYAASATLPPPQITEMRRLLHMSQENTVQLLCTNNRPDVALMVRQMMCPSASFEDLAFLIPCNWQEGMHPPKKFLVFFDNIKETEEATRYFHRHLQKKHHSKVAWFHSTMSPEYRELKVHQFREGEVWGLFCTDAFGLGMDIGDMEVVVQYKATCDLCTLWQRFGRAARGNGVTGVGILLVEKKDVHQGQKTRVKRTIDYSQKGPRKRQRGYKGPAERGIEGEGGGVLMDVGSPCQLLTSATCQATWASERQVCYARPEVIAADPTQSKKGRAPGVLPGSALDDYINAPTFVRCRRLVPKLYFANEQRINDGHHRCDPAAADGCQRCKPPLCHVCCDKCDGEFFLQFPVSSLHKKTKARRSVVPVLYTKSQQHAEVECALYRWRELQALEIFGEGLVHRFGPQLLMSEETIKRILGCWTFGKITEVSHLQKETTWAKEWVQKCGQSLVDVLATHNAFEKKPLVGSAATPPAGMSTQTPSIPPRPIPQPCPLPSITTTSSALTPSIAAPVIPRPNPLPLITSSTVAFAVDVIPAPTVPQVIPSPLIADPGSIMAPPSDQPKLPQTAVANRMPRKHGPARCGLCRQPGHNQRSCPLSKQVKEELIEAVIEGHVRQENTEQEMLFQETRATASAAALSSGSSFPMAKTYNDFWRSIQSRG